MHLLALAHGEEALRQAMLEVDFQGNDRVAAGLNLRGDLLDLRLLQQQLTRAIGGMVVKITEIVLRDVRVVEHHALRADLDKRVGDVGPASAEGLHLGAAQDDPGLEGRADEIVTSRLRVINLGKNMLSAGGHRMTKGLLAGKPAVAGGCLRQADDPQDGTPKRYDLR